MTYQKQKPALSGEEKRLLFLIEEKTETRTICSKSAIELCMSFGYGREYTRRVLHRLEDRGLIRIRMISDAGFKKREVEILPREKD